MVWYYPPGRHVNAKNNKKGFATRERDAETNNDDFGARYYSSQFGRWTSPDWSAVPAPVPYANLTNPQTLNLYAMVSDNPETFADLDGHVGGIGGPVVLPPTESSCTLESGSCQSKTPPQQHNGGSAQNTTPQPQQPDLQQQVVAAQAQQRADANAKLNGPAPGSPEYIAQLSSKVTAETDAAKKYILGPAAAVEGAGLVTVAATGAAAEAVVNGARAGAGAAQNASLRLGAAVDLTVPGGAVAARQFLQGALQPTKASPTVAGLLGAAANVTFNFVKNTFF